MKLLMLKRRPRLGTVSVDADGERDRARAREEGKKGKKGAYGLDTRCVQYYIEIYFDRKWLFNIDMMYYILESIRLV